MTSDDERPRFDLKSVCSMFREANKAVKRAEQVHKNFPTSVLNELRMAFYHVVEAYEAYQNGNVSDGLVAAEKHLKRTYFDAREIEIIIMLKLVEIFDSKCFGYEDVVKDHIQDYANKRIAAQAAQAAIKEAALNFDSREEQYKNYDPHCHTLEKYCVEINAMYPAILTSIRKQKEQAGREERKLAMQRDLEEKKLALQRIGLVLAAIVAVVAVLGFVLK